MVPAQAAHGELRCKFEIARLRSDLSFVLEIVFESIISFKYAPVGSCLVAFFSLKVKM